MIYLLVVIHLQNAHCVKNVCIRSFTGPYFPIFGLNTEPYSVQIRENTDEKNSEDGHFLCSGIDATLATVHLLLKLSINPQKLQFISVQKIEYLGFLIDPVKMKILKKIKQNGFKILIIEISDSSKLRIRDISKVLSSFKVLGSSTGHY